MIRSKSGHYQIDGCYRLLDETSPEGRVIILGNLLDMLLEKKVLTEAEVLDLTNSYFWFESVDDKEKAPE